LPTKIPLHVRARLDPEVDPIFAPPCIAAGSLKKTKEMKFPHASFYST